MDTQVVIVGNLTADPELKFTPNGVAVANFRVAVTPRVRQGDKWVNGDTSFYRVNVWRTLATNVADSLRKGDRALVAGRLRQRSWEDKVSGENRTVTEIEADEVGTSLRWATAKPEKTGGSNGGGNGGDQFADEPPF
jgi:single-strand DNA-binding protein